MALDGILFYKLKNELKKLETGKINKVQEASENEFLFTIRSHKENYKLLISLSPNYARVHLTEETYSFPLEPKSFTMLLRKYFEGAVINSFETHESDRILVISASKYNEMGDFEAKKLIVEIMGRYSNLIIVENDIIKESFHHLGITELRTVLPNIKYTYPDIKDKVNPFNLSEAEFIKLLEDLDSPKQYTQKILGLSTVAANAAFMSNNPAKALYDIIHQDVPYLYEENGKKDFTYFKINDNGRQFDSFSHLLDFYYRNLSKEERIKAKTNNIQSFIAKQIHKNETKITKLQYELQDTKKADEYRLFGELLIANNHLKCRNSSINVLNYYNNEEVEIPLDPRYDLMGNSKLYFKKYQKLKNATMHIKEQIQNATDELEYFKILDNQVRVADLSDILEIQQELIDNHYLMPKHKTERIKKASILTYILEDGSLVLVGKNNIQNEAVTHKLSQPNELWFHVKDAPGSHVLLKKTGDYTEYDIRTCANLAAYYSTFQGSSSVPVNYTKVKNIKKIPGKRNCFVSIKGEKTIYIDPDINLIEKLECKK